MKTKEQYNAHQREYNERHLIFMYVSPQEKQYIESLARSAGIPMSRYLKGLIVEALQLGSAHETL